MPAPSLGGPIFALGTDKHGMPLRGRSADLRGRRHALGIGVRDMATGLGIGLARLLSMEDGTASEEDKIFYRTWLSRIEGWSAGERNIEMQRVSGGGRFR
jgi:hypothetical protein